ncbi:MAG: TlpA family protein disulfide reductase, partial [Nannocystaceae bacterium]
AALVQLVGRRLPVLRNLATMMRMIRAAFHAFPSVVVMMTVATLAVAPVGCSDRSLDLDDAAGSDAQGGDGDGDGEGQDDEHGDGDGDGGGDGDGDGDGGGDGDGDGDGDAEIPEHCQNLPVAGDGPIAEVGDKAVSFEGIDANGDPLDISVACGKPTLLVLCTIWCGPCHDLAAAMAGEELGSESDEAMAIVRELVAADVLEYVEVILDPEGGTEPVDAASLQAWKDSYPNEDIILIGDPTPGDQEEPLHKHINSGGFPDGALINFDYTWRVIGLGKSIDAIVASAP